MSSVSLDVSLEMSLAEAVQLGAVSGVFFSQYFFPKTCRQESPEMHYEIWDLFDRRSRYKGLMAYRDSAKTTLTRICIARRISYLVSRTVLYIGKSENHASKSLRWLKRQVVNNTKWAQAFQLSKGDKWSDEEIEIYHGVAGITITIIGIGITGSPRGINIDDYRPDFIVNDDVLDEENGYTIEQRNKLTKKVMGGVKDSLAPASECPDAAMLVLNTPIAADDLIDQVRRDPAFDFLRISCFDAYGKSTWEARWPTATLQKEKADADRMGRLALFLREKECVVTNPDNASFMESNLRFIDILPERLLIAIGIDPVPPPTPKQITQGLSKKDYEVLSVVGLDPIKNYFYVIDYVMNRGHDPEWTKSKFFELVNKYKPFVATYDAVNYQRVIGSLLQTEMQRRRRWITLDGIDDKQNKIIKITQTLSSVSTNHALFIQPWMTGFKEQFIAFPDAIHDDILDSVSLAINALLNHAPAGYSAEEIAAEKDLYPPLQIRYAAP